MSNVQRPTSTIKPSAKYETNDERRTTNDEHSRDANPEMRDTVISNPLTDEQLVRISDSLRKLIEENDQLKREMGDLDAQLRNLRGERTLESNRLREVSLERDSLRKQTETIASRNSETEKTMRDLQERMAQKERDYNLQIVRLQTELAQALRNPPANSDNGLRITDNEKSTTDDSRNPQSEIRNPEAASSQLPAPSSRSISVDVVSVPPPDAEQRSQAVLEKLNSLQAEKRKLAKDEAKVHYNMGNTFYSQGDYAAAAAEYKKTLELTPEDFNAHYNLAFVAGEYLNDIRASSRHYKQYLFLNPGAEDAEMVRQKIIEAEIWLKGDVQFDSAMNEELRKKKNAYQVTAY